jgi:hypothetical protein
MNTATLRQPSLSHRDHQLRRLAYFRFTLSFRDVEELLAAQGIVVTYKTVRQWCLKFGQTLPTRFGIEKGVLVISGFSMKCLSPSMANCRSGRRYSGYCCSKAP